MSKVRSAVSLVLITILILGLCFMCTVSFSYGTDKMYTFNSVVSMIGKDANLGGMLADGENYLGGGYTAVYYPEGVISAEEYSNNLASLEAAAKADGADSDAAEALSEYEEKYVAYGSSLYLDKEIVCDGGDTVSEEFAENFENVAKLLRERIALLKTENVRLEIRDDYTLQVFLPSFNSAQAVILNYFSYTGQFSFGYGSSADTATMLTLEDGETIKDYFKNASYVSNGSTVAIALHFTGKGRDVLADWTSGAASSSTTLYFKVGDETVIPLSISEAIMGKTLYVSGSYTEDVASAIAIAINTAANSTSSDLSLTVGESVRGEATFGNLALTLLYVSFGVLFVGMMIFFIIRYRALAVAHLYTFLIWLFAMILCVWAIPFLHLGIETFVAVALAGALLAISNAVSYEAARKEFAVGKTMTSSVKTGYKRCSFAILDIHLAVALLSLLVWAIALTELQVFAFTLMLATVFSGLCTLAVNRFHWAAFMTFAKDKGKFCNFKREEEDDE